MTEPSDFRDKKRALELLHALQSEIEEADGLDAQQRGRVLGEIREVQAFVAQSPVDRSETTLGRLESLAVEFETSHPTAAELLNRLANLLASAGI